VGCLGPKERRKSSDLSRRLNSCSDLDDRASSGRLFQTTSWCFSSKARSRIVEGCVRRTSAEVVAERSRRRNYHHIARQQTSETYLRILSSFSYPTLPPLSFPFLFSLPTSSIHSLKFQEGDVKDRCELRTGVWVEPNQKLNSAT